MSNASKIYNKLVLQWNEAKQRYDEVFEDSFMYDGPLEVANLQYTISWLRNPQRWRDTARRSRRTPKIGSAKRMCSCQATTATYPLTRSQQLSSRTCFAKKRRTRR